MKTFNVYYERESDGELCGMIYRRQFECWEDARKEGQRLRPHQRIFVEEVK